ncbi:glycosyltransferase [Nesterenkonia flava]|uniref:Glycosyltransferase n=1 Tax=Nesterenkonia flava TaxID=469799 RepID=A0ABU1FUP7_9MICC|nr:glycosyltransferase [Nesterenkonia flava]MDR5712379.1 glycosyltransferase [Nesterenkonia flava]
MPTVSPFSGAAGLRVVMLSLHTSPLAQAGTGDAGGLNVYVNALSKALASLGVSVDLVTTNLDHHESTQEDRSTTLPDGRRLHVLRVCPTCREDKNRLLECLEDLAARAVSAVQAADPAPVQVIHSHYWLSGLAGRSMAAALDAVLVHTMHTIGAVKRERDPFAQEDPRRDQSEALIAAEAAMLTANTPREAQDLQRLFEIPPSRIRLLRPGTDLSVFHPPVGEDPRSGPLQDRPLRLTYAGRLQPHKGPQVAVAAVARLRQLYPEVPVQLTIAGRQSGPDALDIEDLTAQHGIADEVVLSEPLPHPELAELFRRSDAVLVPSYSESFGLVALEAMACGTPVLAHNVGGLAELVRHRRTGRLIDTLDPDQWAQQMKWLILHRKAWSRYSTTAAHLARQYSWSASAQAALGAYREVSALVQH